MSHRVDPPPARQQRAVGDTGRPSAPTVAKVEPVQTPAAPSPVAPPPVASGSVVPAALPSTYVGSDLSWDSGRSKIVSHFRPSLPSHPGVVGDELQAALDEVATGPEAVAAKTRGFFEAFGTSSFKRASQALAAMTVEEFSALPPRAQFAVAERVAIRRAQEPASSQWAVISRAVGLVEARSLMPVDPKGVFPSEPPTDAAARLARDLGGPFVRLSQGLDADISASAHESASALSALGLSPARANVMLLDRSSGQATFVEHRGLSALVTHLGRINAAALEAGALTVGRKHEPDELLDDAPEPFHQLLMKAAKTGAPLAGDLEPGAQGSNRGIARVMLRQPTPPEQHPDGTVTEQWQAVLVSNDDQLKSFTYSRQVDGRGQAFAPGEWGAGYRPETLRSFVLGSSTTVELGMPHSGAVDAGWSSEAVSTVLGTYAASHTGKTDETVYAVRETDGSVRKLTKDAWNELREAAKLPLPTA